MRLSRKSLVASTLTAGLGSAIVRFPGNAAEYTYKFGMSTPATHPASLHAINMAKKVEADTKGQLQIQVFPQNQLGDDVSMLNQVRTGAIQFYAGVGLVLASVIPLCAMEGVAFAFSSYPKFFETYDGAFGNYIRDGIRKAGLYTFDKVWCLGFQQVFNNVRPINVPQDLEGLKLRTAPAPTEVATFKALGASPATLTSPEVYAALQTHLVDGAVTSLPVAQLFKWTERVKYVTLTRHSFASSTIVANNDAMQSLPAALRSAVDRNMNASGLEERTDVVKLDETTEAQMRSQGLQVNSPDTASFRAVLRKADLYSQWRTQFGTQAWALLEKFVGTLA